MIVHSSSEGIPGRSRLTIPEADYALLQARVPGGDALAKFRRASQQFNGLCETDTRRAVRADPDNGSWLARRKAAQCIECCLRLTSSCDMESGAVTIHVVTEPDCHSAVATTITPDQLVMRGVVIGLSQMLSPQ